MSSSDSTFSTPSTCETLRFSAVRRLLGLSPETARRLLTQHPEHLPPTFVMGARRYVLVSEYERWLAARGEARS